MRAHRKFVLFKILIRTVLATSLLVALVSAFLPLNSLATGPMCKLSCCAGRAPHSAGSCMSGSCHAFLNSAHYHHGSGTNTEKLCGSSRLVRSNPISTFTARKSHPSERSRVTTSSIGKPCQPDCGSCVSGFANSFRQRNDAVIVDFHDPQPPTTSRELNAHFALVKTLSALCRQCAPRGPPAFFS